MKQYFVRLISGYDVIEADGYSIDEGGRLIFENSRGLIVNAGFWVSIVEANQEQIQAYNEQLSKQMMEQMSVGGEA